MANKTQLRRTPTLVASRLDYHSFGVSRKSQDRLCNLEHLALRVGAIDEEARAIKAADDPHPLSRRRRRAGSNEVHARELVVKTGYEPKESRDLVGEIRPYPSLQASQ